MFKGEQYFAKDSFNLALNGNGADYEGFEAIIDQYGSTSAGNLAKAYAGICYFKMGENEKALDLLKSFSGSDDMILSLIHIFSTRSTHCYMNSDTPCTECLQKDHTRAFPAQMSIATLWNFLPN